MANAFQKYRMTTSHGGNVMLVGRWRFNGASAPTSIKANWITSVARTSTGVWTLTINTAYRSWVANSVVIASLELDAAGLSFISTGAYSTSAGTLVVRAYTESAGTLAAADIAAGSNNGNWCHMIVINKEETITDGSGL